MMLLHVTRICWVIQPLRKGRYRYILLILLCKSINCLWNMAARSSPFTDSSLTCILCTCDHQTDLTDQTNPSFFLVQTKRQTQREKGTWPRLLSLSATSAGCSSGSLSLWLSHSLTKYILLRAVYSNSSKAFPAMFSDTSWHLVLVLL